MMKESGRYLFNQVIQFTIISNMTNWYLTPDCYVEEELTSLVDIFGKTILSELNHYKQSDKLNLRAIL